MADQTREKLISLARIMQAVTVGLHNGMPAIGMQSQLELLRDAVTEVLDPIKKLDPMTQVQVDMHMGPVRAQMFKDHGLDVPMQTKPDGS